MSDNSSSNAEARILQIEREAARIYWEIATQLHPRWRGVEEGMGMGWFYGNDRNLSVTLSGQIRGCNSIGFDSADVTIKDHASGNVIVPTFSTDSSGNFEVDFTLDSDPQDIDIFAEPTGTWASRYAASATSTVSLSPGSTTASPLSIPPASGYACSIWVDYPLSVNLTATDNFYWTHTFPPNPFTGSVSTVPGCLAAIPWTITITCTPTTFQYSGVWSTPPFNGSFNNANWTLTSIVVTSSPFQVDLHYALPFGGTDKAWSFYGTPAHSCSATTLVVTITET